MARAHREIMVRTGPPRTAPHERQNGERCGLGQETPGCRAQAWTREIACVRAWHDGFKRAEAKVLKSVAS